MLRMRKTGALCGSLPEQKSPDERKTTSKWGSLEEGRGRREVSTVRSSGPYRAELFGSSRGSVVCERASRRDNRFGKRAPLTASGGSRGKSPGDLQCSPLNNLQTRQKLLTVNGEVDGKPAFILIDSGSSGNFLADEFVRKWDVQLTKCVKSSPGYVQLANGERQIIQCLKRPVSVRVQKYETRLNFHTTRLAGYDCILGQPWLEKEEPYIR